MGDLGEWSVKLSRFLVEFGLFVFGGFAFFFRGRCSFVGVSSFLSGGFR